MPKTTIFPLSIMRPDSKPMDCLGTDCAWWGGMCSIKAIADGVQSVSCDISSMESSLSAIVDRGFPDPALSYKSNRYGTMEGK